YISRMFRNVGYGREVETVVLLVTPRVIINEEETVAAPPAASCPGVPAQTVTPARTAASPCGAAERVPNSFWTETAASVLPPVHDGARPMACRQAPDRATVMRLLPKLCPGIPYLYESSREDLDIRCECLADRIDPPSFYPLVGRAQLHHCQWKCTVSFAER